MKKLALCVAVAAAFTGSVNAGESADIEAYLGFGRYLWDSDRSVTQKDTNTVELGVEVPVTQSVSVEGWAGDFDADIKDSSAELDGLRYSLGGLYHFADGDTRPFVTLSASHLQFEGSSSDRDDELLFGLSLGVKQYLDNVVLRGEVLAFNSNDNELTDAEFRVAIGYAFGRTATAVEEPEPVEEVEEEVAEEEPAPEPEPVAAAPVDSDGDGVFDDADRCPGTAKKLKVDAEGCPIMLTETVSIEMYVKFPTNSAEVTPEYFAEVKKVADFMEQYQGTVVTVEGHCDDRGQDAYNKTLSQKRANSVRQVLIDSFGIPADRVTAVGYGEEQPISDNETEDGRAKNRRVVGVIKSLLQKPATKQ